MQEAKVEAKEPEVEEQANAAAGETAPEKKDAEKVQLEAAVRKAYKKEDKTHTAYLEAFDVHASSAFNEEKEAYNSLKEADAADVKDIKES